MIYIEINSNGEVMRNENYPFHEKHGLGKTKEELLQTGYLIESIPKPQEIPGKQYVMYFNVESNEIYYKYEDALKSENEILRERISALEIALAQVMGV